MVIDNLDIGGAAIRPDKAHTPLIVDANAVLTGAIPFQGFQSIAWRGTQKLQRLRGSQLRQLALGHVLERPEAARLPALEERLRFLALE